MAKMIIEDRKKTMEDLLVNMATELISQFKGELIVGRYDPEYMTLSDVSASDLPGVQGSASFLYIAEKVPSGAIFGIIPRTRKRLIFGVYEGFDDSDIEGFLKDKRAEPIVREHINQYANEKGLAKIHIENLSN